jgi:hypothetical protein
VLEVKEAMDYHCSKDGDIVRGILELLHYRVNLGFPACFVKVRAQRGEPYNEAADRVASTATHDEDVPLLWNAPSGRIIYRFTPDPCESADTLYTAASMNDTIKKFIKSQAALSTLPLLWSHRIFSPTPSQQQRSSG